MPTRIPEVTKARPGRSKPPNSQPKVVAMIQKNQRAQSKFRIFEITNAQSTFYRAGQQSAYEVALQGEEDDEWHKHADESTCSEQMPILATVTDNGRQFHRHYAYVWIRPQDDQSHQVVVPDPEELENSE